MLARISCPACQNQFSIPEGEMGTRQVCGKCHSPFIAGKSMLVAQGAANAPSGPSSGPAPAFNRTMLADSGPDIKFNCPRCKAPQEAPSIEGGTKKACTACGQRLQVPAAPAAAAAPKPSLLNKTMVASDDAWAAAPPIKYNCPACKKPLESPASEGGVKKPCPACGQRHQVPAAAPAGARPNPNKTMLVGDANGPQPVGGQPGYSTPMVAGAAPGAPAPAAPPGGTITIGSVTMSTRTFVLVVAAVVLFLLIVVPAVIRGGKGGEDPVAVAAHNQEIERAKAEVEQRKADVERMNKLEADTRKEVESWASKQLAQEQRNREDHLEAMRSITDQKQRDEMEARFANQQREAEQKRQETEQEQRKLLAEQKEAADKAKADLAAAQAKQQTIIQQPAPVVYYPPYSWHYYAWGW